MNNTSFEGQAGSEKEALHCVGQFAARCGFPEERVLDMRTAVEEAVLNAIEHGLLRERGSSFRIDCSFEKGVLEIHVSHRGARFTPPEVVPDIHAKMDGRDSPRGWGVYLIHQLSDEVVFEEMEGRNVVRMRFVLDKERYPNRSH
jgi:serine/threonine-protein kinase RsbW